MMKLNNTKFLLSKKVMQFFTFLSIVTLFIACNDSSVYYPALQPSEEIYFTTPPPATIIAGKLSDLKVKGFKTGDTILIRSTAANLIAPGEFKVPATVTAFSLKFTCPTACQGEYDLNLLRNKKEKLFLTITVALN
jgi:hypothetical protein